MHPRGDFCVVGISVDCDDPVAYCTHSVSTAIKHRASKPRRISSVRISLRIDPQIKAVLAGAAKLQEVNLTEFLIKSSRTAAESALADRTRFVLSPPKWREFNAALDSPPRDIPALRQLFKEPSVFDPA